MVRTAAEGAAALFKAPSLCVEAEAVKRLQEICEEYEPFPRVLDDAAIYLFAKEQLDCSDPDENSIQLIRNALGNAAAMRLHNCRPSAAS